jgi:hypothetical protein
MHHGFRGCVIVKAVNTSLPASSSRLGMLINSCADCGENRTGWPRSPHRFEANVRSDFRDFDEFAPSIAGIEGRFIHSAVGCGVAGTGTQVDSRLTSGVADW